MTGPLTFRPVVADDESALRRFSCTNPAGKYGATEIERDIQRCKPLRAAQYQTYERFLGLFSEDGVLAACAYHIEDEELDRYVGESTRFIQFLAVADEFKGRSAPGRNTADVLLEQVHEDMRSTDHVQVAAARVHEDHRASRNLLERNGYRLVPEEGRGRYLFYAAEL